MQNMLGEIFLSQFYRDLHNSDEVMHVALSSDKKLKRIKKYLEYLEKTHNKVLASHRKNDLKLLKQTYYKKYVINEVDIPDKYYAIKNNIDLEKTQLSEVLNPQLKKEQGQVIINNQKASLDVWLDYFLSEESSIYPFWVKYWAFQGMLQLGKYDKNSHKFSRRTKDTTFMFPELNKEALSLTIDELIRFLEKNGNRNINDNIFKNLLISGSFAKLYEYVITKLLLNDDSIITTNSGKWIKYDCGSNHMELVKSLSGYNTGWCTAGEGTAKELLSKYDIYVYYSYDANNEPLVPRLSITVSKNKLLEIRGIYKDQNIEPGMEKIVAHKANDFLNNEKYLMAAKDMENLSFIYDKHFDEELTLDELKFLYEIDGKINGFGYKQDPRLQEIIESRNKKKDLAKVFSSNEEQIVINTHELSNNKKIVYCYDSLNSNDTHNLALIQMVRGDINLDELTTIEKLTFPKVVVGELNLSKLVKASEVILPREVRSSLYLNSLVIFKNVTFPKNVGKSLYLDSLLVANGVVFPVEIGEDLSLDSVIIIKESIFPSKVGRTLSLCSLVIVDNLILPKIIGGNVDLSNLVIAKNVTFPNVIEKSLKLNSVLEITNVTFPETIGESLNLSSLTFCKEILFSKFVGNNLSLDSVTVAQNVVLPEIVSGNLNLENLKSIENVAFPKKVGQSLNLYNLTLAKNLILPEIVGGNLHLNNLIFAEGITFPKEVGGKIYLNSLKTLDGLKLPESLKSKVVLPINLTEKINNIKK
ncbi:MAG: hypothetical protein RSB54_00140 [Bacilli bacterium]